MKLKFDSAFLWLVILFVSIFSFLFISMWEVWNQTFSQDLSVQRVDNLLGTYVLVRYKEGKDQEYHLEFNEKVLVQPIGEVVDNIPYNTLIKKIIEARYEGRLQVRFTKLDQVMVWIKDKDADATWVGLPVAPLRKGFEKFTSSYMFIGIVFIFFSAWFFSYIINIYIRSLVKGAEALSVGSIPRFDTRLWPKELRMLAKTFTQSSQILSERTQAKEELLRGVSHDIRTPLFRIRLAIGLIAEGEAEVVETEVVESIVEDIDEINELLSQFIVYSRTGKSELKKEIKIIEVIYDALKHRDIDFQMYDQSITWFCQPIGMKRIIENLLDNGMKHGKSPIKLHVSSDDDELSISVLDHGKGIGSMVGDYKYEDINWEECITSDKEHGLGLSIVNDIAVRNDGVMSLGKNLNDTFYVKIVFSKAER